MWNKVICWLLGHVPDLINVVGNMVMCDRCHQQCGTMDPKPVVSVTAPPGPPKA